LPDSQAIDSGFEMSGADALRLPVLVSVPHAGRDYPDVIFDRLRVPRRALLRLEDRYTDLLARSVRQAGYPLIIAHRARAWIDLNRDERDLDVEMVTGADAADYPTPGAKQRGGLGLIPRRLSGEGELWNGRFDLGDISERISSYHRPYHAGIAEILGAMKAKFGVAVLLDLHSMPPQRPVGDQHAPQFVIGDRFGQSAGSAYAEQLLGLLRAHDRVATLNHPYAGEYILRRHGRPKDNIHALQLEVDRSLYLDPTLLEPSFALASLADLVRDMVEALAEQALGSPMLMAAE
jgi:N-formylglutamate amidohydrolase